MGCGSSVAQNKVSRVTPGETQETQQPVGQVSGAKANGGEAESAFVTNDGGNVQKVNGGEMGSNGPAEDGASVSEYDSHKAHGATVTSNGGDAGGGGSGADLPGQLPDASHSAGAVSANEHNDRGGGDAAELQADKEVEAVMKQPPKTPTPPAAPQPHSQPSEAKHGDDVAPVRQISVTPPHDAAGDSPVAHRNDDNNADIKPDSQPRRGTPEMKAAPLSPHSHDGQSPAGVYRSLSPTTGERRRLVPSERMMRATSKDSIHSNGAGSSNNIPAIAEAAPMTDIDLPAQRQIVMRHSNRRVTFNRDASGEISISTMRAASPIGGSGARSPSVGSSASDGIARRKTSRNTALLIDESRVTQRVSSVGLHRSGYQVDLAESSTQAMVMIKETIFDVVMLDVHMKSLNGVELAKAIRAHEKEQEQLIKTHPVNTVLGGAGGIRATRSGLRSSGNNLLNMLALAPTRAGAKASRVSVNRALDEAMREDDDDDRPHPMRPTIRIQPEVSAAPPASLSPRLHINTLDDKPEGAHVVPSTNVNNAEAGVPVASSANNGENRPEGHPALAPVSKPLRVDVPEQPQRAIIIGIVNAAPSEDELKVYREAGFDGCIERGSLVTEAIQQAVNNIKLGGGFIFVDARNNPIVSSS